MAKHPGKTPAQRRVLDEIGCGDSLPLAPRETFERMVELGLLHRLPDKHLGRDRFGPITIAQYEMTRGAHKAWCEFQAEQYDKDNPND